MTTSETDTGGPTGTVVIVEPADGSTFPGTPDALVKVTAEFTGVTEVSIRVDDDKTFPCPIVNPPQCTADVTLTAGAHTLVAVGIDIGVFVESPPITVEVTAENATTGGAATEGASSGGSDGSTGDGSSSGGSDGSTGDSDSGAAGPDKGGCDCDVDGRPNSGLALLLGAIVLGRRRRRTA